MEMDLSHPLHLFAIFTLHTYTGVTQGAPRRPCLGMGNATPRNKRQLIPPSLSYIWLTPTAINTMGTEVPMTYGYATTKLYGGVAC